MEVKTSRVWRYVIAREWGRATWVVKPRAFSIWLSMWRIRERLEM